MATSKGQSTKNGHDAVGQKVKYSVLPTKDGTDEKSCEADGEKISLLENMESVHISDVGESSSDDNASKPNTRAPITTGVSQPTTNVNDKQSGSKCSEQAKQSGTDEANRASEELDVFPDRVDETGASSRTQQKRDPLIHRAFSTDGTPCTDNGADANLDIVRKMSQPSGGDGHLPWRQIGAYKTLKQKRCQRIYARSGRSDDLALFYVNGRFHMMEAWCTHMGGPLFEGDIEDYNGRCHVMCPWHSYMFDLETGKNEIGLEQKVYDLKLENGHVYVRYKSELSVEPTRKVSEVNSRTINPPTKTSPKSGKVTRKDSVLENVMKLA